MKDAECEYLEDMRKDVFEIRRHVLIRNYVRISVMFELI